jgi:hypothetical protein
MLTSLEMRNFRGVKEGKLDDLTPLVVLVGSNGAGKSAVLDAILIAANPKPGDGIGQTVVRREGSGARFSWLLWKQGAEGPAVISVRDSSDTLRSCTLALHKSNPSTRLTCSVEDFRPDKSRHHHGEMVVEFPPRKESFQVYGNTGPLSGLPYVLFIGPFPKARLRPLHEIYSDLVRAGKREEVTAVIGDLIPDFDHAEVLTEEGAPALYLVFGDRAVPATLTGDGIALLLRLAFELAIRKDDIALLEEPEVHAHPGAIRQVARSIFASVRRGVQVILTTHSLEMIDALLAQVSNPKELELLSVYRLQLRDGILKSSRLRGPDVAFSRSKIEEDLR